MKALGAIILPEVDSRIPINSPLEWIDGCLSSVPAQFPVIVPRHSRGTFRCDGF
jgi:hypothetical protein